MRSKQAVRHITSKASNKVLPQAGSYVSEGVLYGVTEGVSDFA